ncbi:unnamed protein product [Microthlaspi erraticum]|uniref:Uncharacterized protein n=1 Tax=Microthlaspi erraticum TaxID=1685480 RepID=A0A6D2JHP8_9BRAS|nr:unnamed protein product [Microthlaspi erraticum]
MLVIATYIGLNEACAPNRIIIQNDLGPNTPLQFRCRGWNGQDTGIDTLNRVGATYTIELSDVTNYRERTEWNCELRYGAAKEFFFDIQVYRAAAGVRCGQLRHWVARRDGIYFRRDANKPLGHVLHWKR